MNPTELRAVVALALVYALRMLGLFMILPVFVLLGGDLQYATPALIGLALGAYGLSQAVLQIPYGLLSDRFGRKPLIYAGLVIFAGGSVLAATSESIYGVLAGRLLQGAGAIASVLMALVSDLTREQSRTMAMAGIGLSIGLAFALSLVLGPLVSDAFGLPGIFWLTAALALVGIVAVATLVPTPEVSRAHPDVQAAPARIGALLKVPRLLRLDFGIFSLHLVLTAAFLVVPTFLREDLDLVQESHWWVYLSVMGCAFFAMIPFIILAERKRLMKPVMVGAVSLLLLATVLLLGRWNSLAMVWAVLFLFFVAFNLLEASLPSLVSKEAPAASRGTAMGIYSTSQFLGAFTGGAVGGLLLSGWGSAGVLTLMVVALLIWLAVVCTMQPPSYSTSYVVKLKRFGADQLADVRDALAQITGVEDVVILAEADQAFLKVDRKRLDNAALTQSPYVISIQ
ncbi:MFS transporter [Hydrocarboniclastica marina]|uniref:MFS transporter n=1 Tax=Hydrocarboniclastica marina TaxID=2259620 RepID=A0A4P7XDS0_9ALTE|nr:MFS transporter [Hydrocarboniclastica marina]MAL99616.1 MFS transporter [Alteromonadaceae bacterium]QCF24978.1 MFS transporter [Hydrocarboniclastica marina]